MDTERFAFIRAIRGQQVFSPNDETSDEGGARSAESSFAESIGWAICHGSRVRNLTAAHRANLGRRNGDDRSSSPSEGDKLHLVSLVLWVNMNNGADVARLKSFSNDGFGQNDSVMLAYHACTILQRMGGDQSWIISTLIYDPNCSDGRCATVRTIDGTFNAILHAVSGFEG